MTTPFDQQPQPVPPSEGTNDAPEDRANNAPTVPNTVPAGQPNVASDGAATTPMTPATASQQPAGAPLIVYMRSVRNSCSKLFTTS